MLGSFGGVIAASTFLLLGDSIRVKVAALGHQLRGRHAARRRGARIAAAGARAAAAGRALGTLLVGVLAFFLLEKLVIWRHCHDATNAKSTQQRRIARDRRRRVSHVRRRRGHRRRGGDVDPAGHHDRAGGRNARDSAGSRRRRHPPARRVHARTRIHPQPAVRDRRHSRRGGDARWPRNRCPTCCPTCSRSRPAISSTSPCRT